jgi:hypothetical protein
MSGTLVDRTENGFTNTDVDFGKFWKDFVEIFEKHDHLFSRLWKKGVNVSVSWKTKQKPGFCYGWSCCESRSSSVKCRHTHPGQFANIISNINIRVTCPSWLIDYEKRARSKRKKMRKND